MKYLVLLFLVGFASSASLYDGKDETAAELLRDYMVCLENAESLNDALDLDNVYADEDDDDYEPQTELGKKLKEHLEDVLEKIKDHIEKGKQVKEELLEKARELREELKKHGEKLGKKVRELFDKIKDKAKSLVDKLKDLLGLNGDKDKKSLNDRHVAHVDFGIRSLFEKLKKAILDKIDKEALKEKIEKLFGKGSELADELLKIIKEKGEQGKKKILDFIDRILGDNDVERRALGDLWQKIKDYFKDLHIELKERFLKFGEWVKDKIGTHLQHFNEKKEKIKEIAKGFIKHAKDVSKEIAAEGLEFLRPYKEDLGALWDQVKDSVKEVLNRKD